jgi:cardiolipin synthase
VWLSPPPFDHTKLLLVDGLWTLLGSANWDPRSLRLNFEFNVECYDRELATLLTDLARSKIEQSRPLSTTEMDGRSLPVRLRDGVARLFSPYL